MRLLRTSDAVREPGARVSGTRPPAARADDLRIAGLTRLSTCDWPDRLVATVFLQGCPWRCTYCHNPGLLDVRVPGRVPWAIVRQHLATRVGLLDGVVFSGGEPTLQPGLGAAMREAKAMGFGIGLHTGGAHTRRLREVVGLCDWIGLDIKATPELYVAVTGVASAARQAYAALEIVREAGIDVQVRTTVDPAVLTPADVERLTAHLAALGVERHVLQEMRPIPAH